MPRHLQVFLLIGQRELLFLEGLYLVLPGGKLTVLEPVK